MLSDKDTDTAHSAVCGGLAWLVFAPAAVLLARLDRHLNGCFRIHQIMQGALVGLLTLAAIILGAVAVSDAGNEHGDSTHKTMGYALAILLLIQYTVWYARAQAV